MKPFGNACKYPFLKIPGTCCLVIPAQAGIQEYQVAKNPKNCLTGFSIFNAKSYSWIPACAGMTGKKQA
jgi:hypothetical protein